MKINFKWTCLAAVVAAGISSSAWAAEDPFFQITEISNDTKEYGYKLAQKSDEYLSIVQEYDWWSYFDSIPTEIDLSDRFSYSPGCFYDSKVCDAFYDSENEDDQRGHSFFHALVNNLPYTASLLSGGDYSSNLDGYRRNINDDGSVIVGWIDNRERTYESGARFPVVWNNGDMIQLSDLGHGQASESFTADDGALIVGGAASETLITKNERYHYCYERYNEDAFRSNMLNCPGFHNRAVLWLIQDNEVKATQFLNHYDDADKDEISTADIRKIIKIDDTYYALGYSATADIGADSSNLATYWSFKYSDGAFSEVSDYMRPNGLDRPGKGDKHFGSTWFVDANEKGIAVGNARYNALKNRAYPIEMFVFDVTKNETTTPVKNLPFYGATNRAVAINNNNLIVGVSDNRDSQESVVNGNPRQRDVYLYNYNTDKFYSVNDLICTDDTCEINGKYYYIYNVGDINDNNTIIANAYRYDSYKDWANYRNPTNVEILLTSDKFDLTEDKYDIPEEYVVEYSRPEITYGEKKKKRSGSMPLPALLIMSLFAAVRIFRKRS